MYLQFIDTLALFNYITSFFFLILEYSESYSSKNGHKIISIFAADFLFKKNMQIES